MRVRLYLVRLALLDGIGIALLALMAIMAGRYAPLFPASHALLIVQRGSVQIVQAGNHTVHAIPNTDSVAVSGSDVLTVAADGRAVLRFSDDTAVDLFPNTQLAVLEVRAGDASVEVQLRLDNGQIAGHVGAQPDRRARFEVALPLGGDVNARQTDFVALVGHKTFLGAMRGMLTLKYANSEFPISAGNGLEISAEDVANRVHVVPESWAWVRVPLYKPDGSDLTLPITLTRDELPTSTDYFAGESGSTLLVPGGSYKLSVALEAQPAYLLSSLTFPAGLLTEWPLTLGEIQFSFIDSSGKTLPTPTFVLEAENQITLPPDTPILVGPTAGFTLARADTPDQTQYTGNLTIAPGQHLPLPIRADLFGTGGLQANVLDVNSQPLAASAANVSIKVYKPGTEDTAAPPVGTLRSDNAITLFPPSDYVVVIVPLPGSPIAIAARYHVTVNAAQTTALTVKLGTLDVNYVDSSGNSLAPSLIYVAAAEEFKQLNGPIEQLQTLMPLYGYNLPPGQTTITVPAGDYAVQVQDKRAPPLSFISVPPGKVTTMFITALATTSTNTPSGTPVGSAALSDKKD